MNLFLRRIAPAAGFLFFLICGGDVYSFTDQTTTERILRENRYFVSFINTAVTNFADDKKEELKTAYEKHFNGEVAYLQSDYRRAFKRVYASQGDMVKLYEDVLRDHYLEAAKQILDALAPGIIMSKNARARLYLTLGYRDRTVSWTHYTVGEASNPKLHSYKLYKYEEAIKMARRAKRYGFLALFESQKDEVKVKIYNHLLAREKDEGNQYYNRFIGLDDAGMINELSRTYDEYEKSLKEAPAKEGDTAFDQKVSRRVRFRQETRTARYILNREFDQAEDIMRKYVEDFNYKLTSSTFAVVASAQAAPAEGEQAQPLQSKKIDFETYNIHLLDNYQRLARESFLNILVDQVKIEDDTVDRSAPANYDGEPVDKYPPLKDDTQPKAGEQTKTESAPGQADKAKDAPAGTP